MWYFIIGMFNFCFTNIQVSKFEFNTINFILLDLIWVNWLIIKLKGNNDINVYSSVSVFFLDLSEGMYL